MGIAVVFHRSNENMMTVMITVISPYPADHDYCCFYFVILVDQITVIRNEMCV